MISFIKFCEPERLMVIKMPSVCIIGAGLAGCEAAWQLSNRGIKVDLYEMKPHKMSPAHHLDSFAELVCSNSLRSDKLQNAVGLLKQEMRLLNSVIMKCADSARVPAGSALAVDRVNFSRAVTQSIESHPNINIIHEEVAGIPMDSYVIIATGPLTDGAMYDSIRSTAGGEYLHFFDAVAPIVTLQSIDASKVFKAARYGKGKADYINCPMTKEQYEIFYNELINAEVAEFHGFENSEVFEGCMPIEVMAKRGEDTLRYGPLKPVGLSNPDTTEHCYAVAQLRQDNSEGTLYNLVGFQTHLKFPEQKRVFGLIPGLENAEFVRYGVMHRNTFINSPKLLNNNYMLKSNEKLFFAGQITGVEGYVESAASGLTAGISLADILNGKSPIDFTKDTAIGALSHYISDSSVTNFQPMNINFGIIAPLGIKIRDKQEKNEAIAGRALSVIENLKCRMQNAK